MSRHLIRNKKGEAAMDIYVTKEAVSQLEDRFQTSLGYLFITYELGGCGNPLDGVIHIQYLSTLPDNCVDVSTNWIPVYTNHSTAMLLENDLVIDFNANGFFVKSTNQRYSCTLSLLK